jgi:hypothetical protein
MPFHPSRFLAAAVALSGMLLALPAVAQDQNDSDRPARYSVASLHGNYAVVATYGSGIASAVALQWMDGDGHTGGSAVVNQPGPTSATRRVSTISIKGTYSVRPDGTGVIYLTIGLPNGDVAHATEDFVITKAERIDGVLVATAMTDEQRQPSAAIDQDVLVTHSYTRRP